MKTLISTLFTLISISSCNSQNVSYKEKNLVNSFVENIILQNEYNDLKLKTYLDYNEANKNMYSVIQHSIIEIKKQINSLHYTVLSYKELYVQELQPNFSYKDLSKTYYLVVNKKIITTFIVKNNKIISFYYSIKKHRKDKNYPVFLN